MNQDYLKSWAVMSNEMQKPFQEMLELQMTTLKNLRYLRPEDLSNLRNPAEILSRHFSLAMENSQNIFSFMQKSFHIFEEALLSVSQEMREKTEQSMKAAKTGLAAKEKMPEVKSAIRKPAENKKSSSKLTKSASTKPQAKAKSEMKSVKSKTLAAKAKPASDKRNVAEKKMAKPIAQAGKKLETKSKLSMQKKTASAPKTAKPEKKSAPTSQSSMAKTAAKRKAGAEPKTNLLTKKINAPVAQKTMSEKKIMPENKINMPLQNPKAPLIDPKMNFSEKKMPEPKINMPHHKTNALDNKMAQESIAHGFKDKNPFHK